VNRVKPGNIVGAIANPTSRAHRTQAIGRIQDLDTHSHQSDLPQGILRMVFDASAAPSVDEQELEIRSPSCALNLVDPLDRRMTFASGCEPIPLDVDFLPAVGVQAAAPWLGQQFCWPGFFQAWFLIRPMAPISTTWSWTQDSGLARVQCGFRLARQVRLPAVKPTYACSCLLERSTKGSDPGLSGNPPAGSGPIARYRHVDPWESGANVPVRPSVQKRGEPPRG